MSYTENFLSGLSHGLIRETIKKVFRQLTLMAWGIVVVVLAAVLAFIYFF